MKPIRIPCLVLGAAVAASIAGTASADDFYKGRQITMIVGYSAGGGFDIYARIVAAHLGRYIPGNPTIVVQNMPGASSVKAANYLFNVAKKDGTDLGALGSTLVLNYLFGLPGKYEPTKFAYIGRLSSGDSVGVSWHTTGVASIADAKKKSIPLAAGARTGSAVMVPAALNALLGTRFKIIQGYDGANKMVTAMERGEVGGTAAYGLVALLKSKQQWLKDKQVNILFINALERNPAIPDVPTLIELGQTKDDKAIMRLLTSDSVVGRHYTAPPGLPQARVATLRAAFDAMIKGAAFLDFVKAKNIDIDPMSGEKLAAFVEQVCDISPALVEKAKKVTAP